MSETYFPLHSSDGDWNRRLAAKIELTGDRSRQETLVRELREAFPGARVLTIEGGTHDFIVDFQQTIDEVERLLAGDAR